MQPTKRTNSSLSRITPTMNDVNWTQWRDMPLAFLAWTGLALLIFWLASHIYEALLLIVIAALISYSLAPAVKALQRFIPRIIAIFLVYVVFLGGLGIVAYFVGSSAIEEISAVSNFVRTSVISANNQPSPFELNLMKLGIPKQTIESEGTQLVGQIQNIATSAVPVALSVITSLLNIIIIVVLSVYFTIDGPRVRIWIAKHGPASQRERIRFIQNTMEKVAGGYIRGQLIVATLMSSLFGIVLYALGVKFAILLSIVVFIFEFVPILGSLISGAICVLFALNVSLTIAGIALVAFAFLHFLDGYILSPRIVGKSIGLHPIIAITALTAGAELFGIWGALLAAPVAGIIQTILSALWEEWRNAHPYEFLQPAEAVVAANIAPEESIVN